jgi:hypothetical protein
MKTSGELIEALKSGFGLRRKHYYNHSHEEVVGSEFLFYDSKHKYFDKKGWGSAFGDVKDRLEEIIKHPERWEIAGKIEERQWIVEN